MRSSSPISISFSFTAEWQADSEALLLGTERDGPMMFADRRDVSAQSKA
jgi:hypothetical protein